MYRIRLGFRNKSTLVQAFRTCFSLKPLESYVFFYLQLSQRAQRGCQEKTKHTSKSNGCVCSGNIHSTRN